MIKRMIAVLLALILVAASFAGCTKESGSQTQDTKDTATPDTKGTEPSVEPGNEFVQNPDGSFVSGGIKFPLEEKLTFTWYKTADAQIMDLTHGDLNNNTFFQEFERRTNIHFDFHVPAIGTENEQFTLLFSSDKLPDIISGATNYPEGLDGGVDDGYYLDLTELVPKYMPEYINVLKEVNQVSDLMTEKGRMVTLGMIYNHPQAAGAGFIIRKDWLDELGLDIPLTFDELENVLIQFKEKKGCTAPLAFSKFGLFSMAYGYNFFFTTMGNSGSTSVYGDHIGDAVLEIPEEVKGYLARLYKGFKMGLLDPSFHSANG